MFSFMGLSYCFVSGMLCVLSFVGCSYCFPLWYVVFVFLYAMFLLSCLYEMFLLFSIVGRPWGLWGEESEDFSYAKRSKFVRAVIYSKSSKYVVYQRKNFQSMSYFCK